MLAKHRKAFAEAQKGGLVSANQLVGTEISGVSVRWR
jgi:hypothetical protein